MKRADIWTWGAAVCLIAAAAVPGMFELGINAHIYKQSFVFMHAAVEFLAFASCFTIFTLGCLFGADSVTRWQRSLASLYGAVGVLVLMHAMTSEGMPLASADGAVTLPLVYAGMAELAGAIGLLVLFGKGDREAGRAQSRPAMIGAVAASAVVAGGIFAWASGEGLAQGAGVRAVGAVAEGMILMAYALTAALLFFRYRASRPTLASSAIQAIALFALANALLVVDGGGETYAFLAGHGLRLLGFASLIRGMFASAAEAETLRQESCKADIDRDELTGLATRRMLKEQLQAEMIQAKNDNRVLGLLLLDIDRFKTINDALGHTFGDSMIQAVSERLRTAMNGQDRIYRMGGDEFAVVLPGLATTQAAESYAQRLMGMFDRPILLDDAEYHITISIGISFFPQDGESVDVLIKNADTAMYTAKVHRNEFQSYHSEMNQTTRDKLRLESDLRKALENEQFTLAYQPLVNLSTGRIVGVEALVRWQHPQRGLLPPGEFIPLTEENGLILPLGEWVLKAACKQNKAWQDAGMPPMRMSVNLSMRQFRQHKLADRIKSILEQTGMPPEYLELEITESMTSDVEFAIDTLSNLKALGVQISIDDFGTGYSSLGYLKRFPVDKLKIDRSFVTDLTEGSSDAAIVTTITSMARHLKLKVTAEGVENDDQLRFLRERNCEEAQGYYFTKPIPANLFEHWYKRYLQTA
ncbi:putative bifunctional diguanylate cyclase/phosphodiesterase [Paenibacillus methanolicus]|uniref:Diguanylate cyclase (GGDEF)-like protein n=1 Tax=Paenibacillus methanolicus TaxID=582686 RepID=A0A5S5BU66_9BACL|nr:EAL domain-containing protein [Paenibacillus methanolicus]TYP69752.1 diguanylate cyclase (GGDEF)-like protein [Paenibacillus methanolicus]